jgi:hypothetical protein
MSKYSALGVFLRRQRTGHVPLTFSKIEEVIEGKLPASARYSAWWSNNPTNNVMTKVWLEAGFRSEQVDVPGRKVVFRRAQTTTPASISTSDHHPLFGALKGLVQITPGTDLTRPADPDWGRDK